MGQKEKVMRCNELRDNSALRLFQGPVATVRENRLRSVLERDLVGVISYDLQIQQRSVTSSDRLKVFMPARLMLHIH